VAQALNCARSAREQGLDGITLWWAPWDGGAAAVEFLRLLAVEYETEYLKEPGEREENEENSGLVGHWTLDDGSGSRAADASASGHPGALLGSPDWVASQRGGALDFSQRGDAVRVASSAQLDDLESFSVALWFYADTTGNNGQGRFVSKGDSFQIRYSNNSSSIYFDAKRWGGREGRWRFITPDRQSTRRAWHHLVVAYDYANSANDPVAYLDGNRLLDLDELQAPSGRLQGSTGDLYLGNRESLDRTFDGRLDDVRVYRRLLTPEEVMQLASGG
jgi:hypothetical protein